MGVPATMPGASPRARATIDRFVRVPVDLVLAYRSQPANAAVYAVIARLCEIARGPVVLSRDDLALLFAATRDAPTGVKIERAIRQLRADGWLLHPNQGHAGKRQLVVTWGHAADGTPRPWQFGQPDRARPRRLTTVRVPLALFDHYLGRLILQPDAPASIERYVSQPLLDLADISTFITRQIGGPATTPRLARFDLLDPSLPTLGTLLTTIAAGTCTSATGALVALTSAGMQQLQRCRAADTLCASDDRHGSLDDPQPQARGSRAGSADSCEHYAAGCTKTVGSAVSSDPWEKHGKNQRINMISSRHDLHAVPATAAGAITTNEVGDHQDQPAHTEHPERSCTQTDTHPAARDICHDAVIEPRLVMAHQWLNADRAIPAAEWWTFAQVVQAHGAARVWTWQQRALAAGRRSVTLGYYAACAATAAFERAHSHPPAAASSAPVANSGVGIATPDAPAAAARSTAAPRVMLSADHHAVLARMSAAMQTPIRYPEKLAAVSLDLLEQWATVAGHPGLRAKGDPAALFVHAAKQGKAPPAMAELNRWAEQHGTHWSQLGAWTNTQELASADVPPAVPPAGAHLAPVPAPAEPAMLCDAGMVQQHLIAQLQARRPRTEWPLFVGLRVVLQDASLVLICATPQQRATLDGSMRGCIQSALAELGEQRTLRLMVAGGGER